MPRLISIFAKLLPCLMIFCSAYAAASSINYPNKLFFNDLLAKSNVGLGEVEVVFQDSHGFIWLGGRNALARYDGYDFRLMDIRVDANDPSKDVQAQHVVDIFEASTGRLWIATRKGSLWLDRDKDILRPLIKKTSSGDALDTETINTITQAPTGEIIMGAYGGVYVIEPSSLIAKILPHTDTHLYPNSALNDEVIHDFVWSPDKRYLWIATRKGLTKLEWATQKFSHFIPHPESPYSFPDNELWVIKLDKNGHIWGGSHSGVYIFDTAAEQYIRKYQHNSEDPFSLAANLIRNILIDANGWVWIGSDGGGLNLYDQNNDRFVSFKADKSEKGSLASNSVRAMYQDNNGDLWIGTYPEGMNFYDQSLSALSLYTHNSTNPNSLPHNSVLTVQEDKLGNLWLGTDGGGISYFDRHKNTFKHYQVENNKVSSNAILTSYIDSKNQLWIGTWGAGALKYNPEDDAFIQIPFDPTLKGQGSGVYDALNDEAVWAITEDNQGHIWFGTHDGGLSQYDEKTQKFVNYSLDRDNNQSLSNQLVWSIYQDSREQLWIGTSNGLNRYNPNTDNFTRYFPDDLDDTTLSHNSIISIYEDHAGDMWFGTDRGINKFEPSSQTFKQYTKSYGFVDDGIRSIQQDANGDLWIGTNNGVVRFNPLTEEIINYEHIAGESLGTFNTGAVIKSIRNEIILGSSNGLRVFDVSNLSTNTKPPKIVLTQFNIFTQPITIDDDSGILKKELNLVDSITLDYKKNMFSIDFSALNYRDAERNQYAYKLDGFDNDWREVGHNRRALYTNLDGGTYTFKVRGSNNDGVWNTQPKTLTLIQEPPPWKTWWAYTLYIFIVIGAIAQLIYAQRRKQYAIEEQNEILERTVAQRTHELRQKNNDIKAMLENMQQGLFTIESSGLIHSEYSRFLEEIFNTKHIAGKRAVALLFDNANNLGNDTLNQVQEGLDTMIGEDTFNFDINEHILPREYEIINDHGIQHLSLDWDPIINSSDNVERIMVSVRDTTRLKLAEADAHKQKRELKIIAELIKIPYYKYISFEESTAVFLDESDKTIQANALRNDDAIARLFRNMHTIKGNCRTFGFSHLSDTVHDVETYYSTLKTQHSLPWDTHRLTRDIQRVRKAIAEYSHLYFTLLGRSDASKNNGANNLLDATTIEHIQHCLKETTSTYPEAGKSIPLQSAHILLDIALSNTLTDALSDITNSLPTLAQKLGKEAPKVNITESNIRIRNSANELIVNVFTHLLRNSLDHGLEPAIQRAQAGKEPSGTISIRTSVNEQTLCIHLADNGRGLNIDKLLAKGKAMETWLDTEEPSAKAVANLIFVPGASTKENVSDISGRGVGMDAVKQFLKDAGGDIELHLLAPKKENDPYVPFETIVTLPSHTFTSIQLDL